MSESCHKVSLRWKLTKSYYYFQKQANKNRTKTTTNLTAKHELGLFHTGSPSFPSGPRSPTGPPSPCQQNNLKKKITNVCSLKFKSVFKCSIDWSIHYKLSSEGYMNFLKILPPGSDLRGEWFPN